MSNKKRALAAGLLVCLLLSAVCGGCQNSVARKAGLVTASGELESNGFNRNIWEGLTRAGQQFDLEIKHYKPETEDDAGYLAGIKTLRADGCKIIVCAGENFKDTLTSAQDTYSDCRFIAVDFTPASVGENTASVLFAEHESAFLVGVAAALQLKEGRAGGILGARSKPVGRFLSGFLQGIDYANREFRTKIQAEIGDFPYIDSFTDETAAKNTAARLYDDGVDVVFDVAGSAGLGAIAEARERALLGENVWVIGVDVDQYPLGVYDEAGHSVVLTSAIKRVGTAVFKVIEQERRGEFPGGETLIFDAKNEGVGIPEENPNLSEDVQKTVEILAEKIKSGELTVDSEWK